MEKHVTTGRFHSELVKDLFNSSLPTDEEALCLMLLLHACRLSLSELSNVAGGVKGFEGITSRHASEVVASIFSSGQKAHAQYWYELWNGDWKAYAILENPPPQLMPSLMRMRDFIESHPWVERLENDDWQLLPDSLS